MSEPFVFDPRCDPENSQERTSAQWEKPSVARGRQ